MVTPTSVSTKKVNEVFAAIQKLQARNGFATNTSIAEVTGFNNVNLNNSIKKLMEQGRITKTVSPAIPGTTGRRPYRYVTK